MQKGQPEGYPFASDIGRQRRRRLLAGAKLQLRGVAASAKANGVTLQLSGFGTDLQIVAPVSSSTN
jgi:hypothetical protein